MIAKDLEGRLSSINNFPNEEIQLSEGDGIQNSVSAVEQMYEGAIAAATGLPPQLQRSLLKTIGHVFSSAGKWTSTFFDGRSRISAAQTSVRVARLDAETSDIKSKQKSREIIERESAKSVSKLFANSDVAERALAYHTSHIISKQERYEDILKIAVEEISSDPPVTDSTKIIEDDILESILREGSTRSSEDFKILFGKILAGEIKNPGTFSIGTIQSLGRPTAETAEYFQVFCSLAISDIVSPKVVSNPFGSAGENKLSEFGLSYIVLARLVEEGLLRHDFNEWQEINISLIEQKVVLRIGGDKFFMSKDSDAFSKPIPSSIRLTGPTLTKAGQELQTIVSTKHSVEYVKKLSDWFKDNGVILYKVVKIENDLVYGSPIL